MSGGTRIPLSDPPVRPDNLCALDTCRKPRRLTQQARKYAGWQLDVDPFCTRSCAEEWHGVDPRFACDEAVDG